MLTSYADDEALYASVMAGASGYVLKRIRAGELIEDVKKVAGGASLMDPRAVARVVERIRKGPQEDPRTADLSPQERRILDLIAEGHTNRQIATEMILAEKTVKNYITSLLAKLKMTSRTEAAVFAARREGKTGAILNGSSAARRCDDGRPTSGPFPSRPGRAPGASARPRLPEGSPAWWLCPRLRTAV